MNTVLFQYAVEVEKTGSITQAANNLYMDQPNLSKAIKTLEENLGVPIFNRTPKGVVPTDKGRIFLRYAHSILSQLEEMERLYRPSAGEGALLRLPAPGFYHVGAAFSRFVGRLDEKAPADLRLWEREPSRILEMVGNGECEIGVMDYQASCEKQVEQLLEERGLDSILVWEYQNRVFLSRRHPLSGMKQIEAEQLAGYCQIWGETLIRREDVVEEGKRQPPDRSVCVEGKRQPPDRSVCVEGKRQPPDRSVCMEGKRQPPDRSVCVEGKRQPPDRSISVEGMANRLLLLGSSRDAYMWAPPVPEDTAAQYGLAQTVCPLPEQEYREVVVCRKGHVQSCWEKMYIEQLKQVCEEIMRECRM